ncbi:MAG: murein L,D-transpeptidase family protein [Burkholderiaceae bacterium]
MKTTLRICMTALLLGQMAAGASAVTKKPPPAPAAQARQVVNMEREAEPEAQLIQAYQAVAQGNRRSALALAEGLVQAYPNFQVAQLLYGDLLAAQARPARTLGDVKEPLARQHAAQLAELREESLLRLKALSERPPAGSLPAQFVNLSAQNQHAIAIDASRSRLYLFENTVAGPKLLADYYISIGKSGIEKTIEGDLRTPLGVYFINHPINPKTLKPFYGAGALPINYPNPYDMRRGKTGSGIWLHGTPPEQFSRPPRATDGCVVLANPDLQRLLATVAPRTTPVVIAQSLQWVSPQSLQTQSRQFEDTLQAWRRVKSSGRLDQLLGFYTNDFDSYGKNLSRWSQVLRREINQAAGHPVQLNDLSLLRFTDQTETMVVTFREAWPGSDSKAVKRQYWLRQGTQWRIFFEGVVS